MKGLSGEVSPAFTSRSRDVSSAATTFAFDPLWTAVREHVKPPHSPDEMALA